MSAGGCCGNVRPVGVRMPQMCWLRSASSGVLMRAGLANAATPVQACRFCGLVSRLATFPGVVRHLLALLLRGMRTLGLVRAGCGEGECGGSRLVGSEKSPIVTLSAVRGAGRADRERTDDDCVHRTRRWGPSHLQESAVLAGYRSPRHTAGVRCSDAAEPSATLPRPGCFARQVARAAPVLQVRVAGHC